MAVPKKNTRSYLVGTGEFRFSPGATSAADTKLKGWRDVGNIVAFTPESENSVEEHEGSYRGRKIVDKKYSTKEKLEYLLTCDEWKKENLKFLFMAGDGTDHTQAAHALAAGDSMAFTAQVPTASDRWYDLYSGGTRVRNLTALVISSEPTANVTASDTTDLISEAAHTRQNGDPIVFGGTVVPTGLTAGVVHYVRDVAAGEYKVAATAGGAAIDLGSTGTAVTVRAALVEGTDYEVDLTLGSVRFLVQQTATVYPVISAPAIATAGDAGFMHGLVPLEDPIEEGYGELIIYDEDEDNERVLHHELFSCTCTAEKSNAIDGKKTAEFSLRITVTKDPGNLLVREDEPA